MLKKNCDFYGDKVSAQDELSRILNAYNKWYNKIFIIISLFIIKCKVFITWARKLQFTHKKRLKTKNETNKFYKK